MSPVPVSCVNAVTAPANTQPIAQNAAVSRARYLPAPKESKHIPTAAQSFTRPLRRNPSSGSTAAKASCRNQPPPEKLLPAQPRAACKKPRINRRVERKKRFCTKPHAPLPFPLVLDKV